MKIAFINPIHYLELQNSDYHLALTHLVLKYPKYAQFYKECREKGDFVILDNSLIELGEAVEIDKVLEAAEIINPNEIVLPDVFLNKNETINTVIKTLFELVSKKGTISKYKLQVVCHGKNDKEWKECWDTFSVYPEIDCIAIPKVTTTIFKGGRPEAVRYALENNPNNKDIHLLGIWEDVSELKEYTEEEREKIRGVDSSIFFHCTVEGQSFEKGETKKPDYKIDLENKYNFDFKLLEENINYENSLVNSVR